MTTLRVVRSSGFSFVGSQDVMATRDVLDYDRFLKRICGSALRGMLVFLVPGQIGLSGPLKQHRICTCQGLLLNDSEPAKKRSLIKLGLANLG